MASNIVLYDGQCGFCDRTVQWLLDHDRQGRLRYAALQGPTAREVQARHPRLPPGLDSLILVQTEHGGRERVYWYSRAVVRILWLLPWPWRALAVMVLIPRPLRDLGYRAFARIRFRVFGRLDACRVPTAEERARFLDQGAPGSGLVT